MVYGGYSYFDTKYEPHKDDFVTVLWIKGTRQFEKMAEGLAAESSIGTWTKLSTMNDSVWKHFRAHIFKTVKVSAKSGFVYIAYPYEHFDSTNLSQILASIRGNIFGLKEITELKFLDWIIPKKFQKQFSGPVTGIKDLRKIVGSRKRPHSGTIVKPKVGLSAKEWAGVAEQAFMGGLDMVKDDENLVNQKFCPWKSRVLRVIKAANKAKDKTGDGKIYVPNISDTLPKMLDRIDFLKDHGWKMAMIDVYVMGLTGLQEILKELHKKKFIVHAHRAGYDAEHRGPWGVGYVFWEKLYRMLGVSSLHTGTGVGKMAGSSLEVYKYGEVARGNVEAMEPFFLEQKWASNIKPIMPVASGGMYPGLVEGAAAIYGKDVTIMAGGGVHGHPGGTLKGAIAHRAAVDAIGEGKTLKEKAKEVPELAVALKKWGYVSGKSIETRLKKERMSFRKNAFKSGWNLDKAVKS